MDITKLTDEELKNELTRRRELKIAAWEEAKVVHKKLCEKNINFLLMLTPEHSRTSCSDNDICNGFMDHEHYPRCIRCFLLGVAGSEEWPEIAKLSISIDHHKFTE